MKFTFLTYNTSVKNVIASGPVIREDNCNGYVACNTGDTIATVDGQILYPGVVGTSLGDSMTTGGNFGEIFMGNIEVFFDTTAGANPRVTIRQKCYMLPEPVRKPQ